MSFYMIAEIIVAILLSTVILVQQQGTGLGGAFGGEGNVYRSRRGVERLLYYATIVLAIIFFGIAVVAVATKA